MKKKRGIPNFKHFILKRLPDAPNGKVCWVLTQEKGEIPVHAEWNIYELRKEASKLKVGETKTLLYQPSKKG